MFGMYLISMLIRDLLLFMQNFEFQTQLVGSIKLCVCCQILKQVVGWPDLQSGGCVAESSKRWLCGQILKLVAVWPDLQSGGCVAKSSKWWLCDQIFKLVAV